MASPELLAEIVPNQTARTVILTGWVLGRRRKKARLSSVVIDLARR
jgi:hypothetical protein